MAFVLFPLGGTFWGIYLWKDIQLQNSTTQTTDSDQQDKDETP